MYEKLAFDENCRFVNSLNDQILRRKKNMQSIFNRNHNVGRILSFSRVFFASSDYYETHTRNIEQLLSQRTTTIQSGSLKRLHEIFQQDIVNAGGIFLNFFFSVTLTNTISLYRQQVGTPSPFFSSSSEPGWNFPVFVLS